MGEADMEVIRLPEGESAAKDSDCISVQQLPEGGFRLMGSALLRCGDTDEAESVAMIGGDPYADYDTAEAAGLAWAAEHCVETLFVSRSAGTEPLPD